MPGESPVYIEISGWSAVLDPRIPGGQQMTRQFLRAVARRRRLLVSDQAVAELRAHPLVGIRRAIHRFLRRLRPKVLGPTGVIRQVTEDLMLQGGWSLKAVADVTQVAYAVVGGAEVFVTWNPKDLARDHVRKGVERYCKERGRRVLHIGTPREAAVWLGLKL